jgi:tRNA 2-thiouridine synthesizing protein A
VSGLILDERGQLCPLPVIALARGARGRAAGEIITVLADDPAADFDIPAWCQMRGHEFLDRSQWPAGGVAYRVELKAGGSSTATASNCK